MTCARPGCDAPVVWWDGASFLCCDHAATLVRTGGKVWPAEAAICSWSADVRWTA